MQIKDNHLNFRGSLPHNNCPGLLVLHHTECNGWTVERLHQLHLNNGWIGIGYHYYVRKNGTIYKGRPDYTRGAHCKGANTNSLGISFEGCYNSIDKEMPKAQFDAGIELIRYLKSKYGNMPIKGHREVGSSDCPGKYFPLNAFRDGKVTNVTINKISSSNKKLWQVSINGEVVKELQRELNKQFNANLKVDGYFGDSTLNKCVTVHRGARGNISKIIQQRLISCGAKNIVANGIFQDGTYGALRIFQKNHGLMVDGICGRNTWKALYSK